MKLMFIFHGKRAGDPDPGEPIRHGGEMIAQGQPSTAKRGCVPPRETARYRP